MRENADHLKALSGIYIKDYTVCLVTIVCILLGYV